MSRKRREGLLACALAGLMALAIEGCGGDSGNGNNGGAADAAPDVSRGVHREGGLVVPDAGGGQPEAATATAQPFDGTSGKPCSSHADCASNADGGGAGMNVAAATFTAERPTPAME